MDSRQFPGMTSLKSALNNNKTSKGRGASSATSDKSRKQEEVPEKKIKKMTVNELKDLCRMRGLPCSGTKLQLLTRLAQPDAKPAVEVASDQKNKRKRASEEEVKEVKKVKLDKIASDEAPKGTWAQACIKKWKLLAPYDLDVTEAQWEAYFKERKALEDKSDDDDNSYNYVEDWSEQVLKKSRENLRKVVKGIKQLDNSADLFKTLENGIYVLLDEVLFEDVDEPRAINTDVRLYSPIGNASSVQFQYDFHLRPRWHEVEYFVSLHGAVRSPTMLGKKQPDLSKTGTKLIDKFRCDKKRKFERTIPSVTTLKNYEHALFGTMGKVSALKMLKIVGCAAGCDTHGESEYEDWVVRLAIRDHKMKLNKNEETDDEADSYNDDSKSNCTEPPSHESDSDDMDDSDDEGNHQYWKGPPIYYNKASVLSLNRF